MKPKPVVFTEGATTFYRENSLAQNILLKALSNGVTDPNELRKLAGLKATADVFRTLDKMAIRKEYHQALSASGLSFESIVNQIKNIGESGSSDSVRLKAWTVILKSLGLDKYEKQEDSSKSWEDALLGSIEETKKLPEGKTIEGEVVDYEVKTPEVPVEERIRREKSSAAEKGLYDKP